MRTEAVELLEDLGVKVIEDASNESTDVSTSTIAAAVKPVDVKHVLQQQDSNVRKTTQTCTDLNIRKCLQKKTLLTDY